MKARSTRRERLSQRDCVNEETDDQSKEVDDAVMTHLLKRCYDFDRANVRQTWTHVRTPARETNLAYFYEVYS